MSESEQTTMSRSLGGKFEIARAMGNFETIGEDLVAKVADALVVSGIQPTSMRIEIPNNVVEEGSIATINRGTARGSLKAGIKFISEAGEQEGLQRNESDFIGVATGVLDANLQLDSSQIKSGDLLIAMPASGMHSSGFKLVQEILVAQQLSLTHNYDFSKSLGEVLLTPSEIYTLDCLALIRAQARNIRAFSQIGDGGLAENTARVIPACFTAIYDRSTWTIPLEMKFLAETTDLSQDDMERTWNCGIGMVAIVDSTIGDLTIASLAARGMKAWIAGEVVDGSDLAAPRSYLASHYR